MIDGRTPLLGRAWDVSLVLLLFAAPVRAEDGSSVKFPGESQGEAAALRLDEAGKKLADHKWSEAIEELQTILTTAGGDLVAVTPTHSIRAGRLCHILLASLPAEALRLYRRRYENQAGKKLQQAQAERDVAQLRKLVEDAFCTRAAEKAIDLLGDLAFERGRFAEAEEWWRLLAPLPDGQGEAPPPRSQTPFGNLVLVYPGLSLDPARVQAKQLLARLFQSSDNVGQAFQPDGQAKRQAGKPDLHGSEWTAALDAYSQRHGQAEGTLAGRKGRYVDLLRALAEEREKQGLVGQEDWPTFGGSPGRGQVVPASKDILDHLSALCREGPTWTVDLKERARQDEEGHSPAVSATQARTLAFSPVLIGHQVLVADARYVTAFDVRNGRSEQWYDAADKNGGVNPNLELPAPPDLRYTLSVAGDRVYVRLGAQNIGMNTPRPRGDEETFLACLGLRPDNKGEHFRWQIGGIAPHDRALFEGAPLAADGLIWIASLRYRGGQAVTAIECYSADDTNAPPLRWRSEVCETDQPKPGEPRYRHHLLTLAGSQLVYCTHSGAVVAVDALTGRRNWAIRYPNRMSETEEVDLRDLAPVLFAAGRLYVAPADSDSLLCLDPATGRTLWELQPLRVVHLLGVGQGRLIFTTPKGLRAVRPDDGSPAWAVPDSGTLTPAGRGLLIGDLVLFPTTQVRDTGSPSLRTVVYALRQRDGRPADDPAKLHRLPAGNLAYANGCLAVADRQTLSVFVPPRLLLTEREAEARRHPGSAAALLDLARAEADAGDDDKALRTLHRALELLGRGPKTCTRKKLLAQSLRAKQRLLLARAERAAQEKRWSDAENALARAAALPLPPRSRLHALLRAAQIWQDADQKDRGKRIWKSIREDERLHTIPVVDRQGRPISVARG